ncbi:hypothetical protein ES702_04927 [subsurface metagenome]
MALFILDTKEKIVNLLEALAGVAAIFTLIHMWMATCIYLALNVNNISANSCFYGGLAWLILTMATSPRMKRWLKLG